MNVDNAPTVKNEEHAASFIVDLMLSPFNELIEVNYATGRVRTLRHTEGKYFSPVADASLRDIRRYCAENLVHPDDLERYLAESDPTTARSRIVELANTGVHRERFRFRLLSGGWRWVEQIAVSGAQNGIPRGICYLFLCDLPDEVIDGKTPSVVPANAQRSELTGLLRENDFYSCAERLLRTHPEGWCMIAADLDHFKLFNEWYGRAQGDLLLAQIGGKLRGAEEETGGLACYFGQDDFALLIPYDREQIEQLYAAIHDLIIEYGTSVGFLPAFGIAMSNVGNTAYELYDRAATAARRAKDSFQKRIRIFDPKMYEQTDQDYRILSDFQKGLEDHELFIMFQPQCRIDNRKVVGAESLVRWRKADGELVPPGVFVPVLERYGFVTELDKYVWEEVCAWQKRWIDSGHTPLPISVNVSQIDIYSIDVPTLFDRLIEKYALPADSIKVEITESAYVDNDSVAETVKRLREKGFLVLMDDFGSGYSSLNMLRNLNVDIIKLDAQFLRMSGEDKKGLQIMESVVNMAKTMGVPIIVEGVETEQEMSFLAHLGCRYVQGYYFFRPMPAEEFENLIAAPKNVDHNGFRIRTGEQFRIREFLDRNMFSDTVLNNILGPVAFFLWHGDDVDVVRYNQQFYEEIKIPHFQRHTASVQKRVATEDVGLFFTLLRRAVSDPMSGSEGVVRLALADGSTAQFRLHFYYINEDKEGKMFYASVHDVTKFIALSDHMRLLSLLSPDSVVFLRRSNGELTFQAAAHGLGDCLGLSREEFERELGDGRFRERIDPAVREKLLQLIVNSAQKMTEFSPPFTVKTANGGEVRLRMRFNAVDDPASGEECLLILRKAEE